MGEPTFAGQPWAPTVFTPPLSDPFDSAADALLPLVDHVWQHATGERLVLDAWQRAVVRHALETRPDGSLRYRQCVISMARQNGKSLIAAILGLWGLLQRGSEVLGIATNVDQARIVYDRVRHQIETTPALTARYSTTTVSARGIKSRDGMPPGSYVVKAGASKSIQGVPIWPLAIADELHLWQPAVWDALLFGTAATGGSIFGITTAGDDTSSLLKRLYALGRAAASRQEGHDPRFGLFVWEAPDGCAVDDADALRAANPMLACGRRDVAEEQRQARQIPEPEARRYRLNQFVSSSASWMPLSDWVGLPVGQIPAKADLYFAVARDLGWRHATVTVAARDADTLHSEVVATLDRPTIQGLEDMLMDLWRRWGSRRQRVVMPAATLRELALRLRKRGVTTEYLTQAQITQATSIAYAAVSERRVTHDRAEVVTSQVPQSVARSSGDGVSLSRRDSTGPVDALEATICGLYAAEVNRPQSPALVVA